MDINDVFEHDATLEQRLRVESEFKPGMLRMMERATDAVDRSADSNDEIVDAMREMRASLSRIEQALFANNDGRGNANMLSSIRNTLWLIAGAALAIWWTLL